MLSAAATMLALTGADVDAVPRTATLRAGVVAVIGIFGLAWLGDSFVAANKDAILPAIGRWAGAAPWTFARRFGPAAPGTAMTAPIIPPQALSAGWSDLGTDTEMMRFVYPGNLTGLPAITFPVGYDSNGMPVAMQAMGRHWEENLLLRVAYNAELHIERKLPGIYLAQKLE